MKDEQCMLNHGCTRREALRNGDLVDVSKTAREAGITLPTAVTEYVWRKYVEVPKDVPWQDEARRLWELLWMLRRAILREKPTEKTLFYRALVQNRPEAVDRVKLKAICGPDDGGRPVVTIMAAMEE